MAGYRRHRDRTSVRGSVEGLLLVALAGWILVVPIPSASAACPAETQIFVEKVSNVGTTSWSYGTVNDIEVINRNLDSCTGAAAISTAHVENTTHTKLAEVGWWEDLDGSGAKRWRVFVEGCRSLTDCTVQSFGGVTIGINETDRFKVNNIAGYSDGRWNYFVDRNADGGYVQVPSSGFYMVLGFDHGWAEGETTRFGNATGAHDHQLNLQFKGCSSGCTWYHWGNPELDCDSLNNYDWVRLSTDAYSVQQGSATLKTCSHGGP